ncbi:MAG: hypothetical protein WC503_04630 [Candidatus Shapirobacteria bacterium]
MDILCSRNNYIRNEAEKMLRSRKWFQTSTKEIQNKILTIPEIFNGFLNDLADRQENFDDFETLRMVDFNYNDHFAHSVFEVKSNFTGITGQKVYTAWKKGSYHSMRGILLLETNGRISHFLVRNCQRYAVGEEISESIGSIHPPMDLIMGGKIPTMYLEQELKNMTRLPKVEINRYFDLGKIYPDPSMSDNIVSLFAVTTKINNIEEISKHFENKKYDDKGYSFSFEVIQIEKLLDFLSKTNDAFLLSIFGRLQALNVINL